MFFSLPRDTSLRFKYYLILHGFPVTFNVPISQDDALFVHSGLLLQVFFKHPDFQATSQDDGSITYIQYICKYMSTTYALQNKTGVNTPVFLSKHSCFVERLQLTDRLDRLPSIIWVT